MRIPVPRPLAPLTSQLELAGTTVSFPLEMRAATRTAVLFSVPRRLSETLLGDGPLRPVPTGPRAMAMYAAYTTWVDTPVGPFREVSLMVPVYHGTGSPVPGLAPVLHGLLDRTDVVGAFGFMPILSLVDGDQAAAFRGQIWSVPAHRANLRSREEGSSTVVQVEHAGDPVLRMSVDGGSRAPAQRLSVTMPIYGIRADGQAWHDRGTVRVGTSSRRYRIGAGHISIFGAGPLLDLAFALGVTTSGGFSRRARISDRSTDGVVRWAGPRDLQDHEASEDAAFTGG